MKDSYTQRNQRQTAEAICKIYSETNSLTAALEYLAVYADWEADDPKTIIFNIVELCLSKKI